MDEAGRTRAHSHRITEELKQKPRLQRRFIKIKICLFTECLFLECSVCYLFNVGNDEDMKISGAVKLTLRLMTFNAF